MKKSMRKLLTLTLLAAFMTPLLLTLDMRPARADNTPSEQRADKKDPRKPKPTPGPRGEGDGD